MTTEVQEIPKTEALSAADRIRNANLKDLSPFAATELAMGYFREEKRIFESRFVALRHIVPENIQSVWDAQAEQFAKISGAVEKGDTRQVKDFVIRSGMELNRQAIKDPTNNKHLGNFGRALYVIGSCMQVSVGFKR